jgi:surfeit locus 1 family protein
MANATNKKPLPIYATLLMLLGVVILCGLGTWQLKRLAWKTELLEQIDHAYSADQTTPLDLNNNAPDASFIAGQITGTLMPGKSITLGPRVLDNKVGYHLITPLLIEGADQTLLINLGWIEDQNIPPLPEGTITFSGVARMPDYNNFTPINDPEQNQWYRADINQIAAHHSLHNPAPYILYQAHSSKPIPTQTIPRWEPNNNHAQYAVFWFSMAFVLVVIYWLRFIRKSYST